MKSKLHLGALRRTKATTTTLDKMNSPLSYEYEWNQTEKMDILLHMWRCVYHIVNKPKYAVCTLISLAIDITLVIWVSVKVFTRSIFSMIRNTITLTALTFTAIAFWILYFDYHNDYNGKSAEKRKRWIKIK